MIVVISIESMCPADGWYGVFFIEKEPYYELTPLACWANVRYSFDLEMTEIFPGIVGYIPMEGTLDECESIENFFNYIHESERNNKEWKTFLREEGLRYKKDREKKSDSRKKKG